MKFTDEMRDALRSETKTGCTCDECIDMRLAAVAPLIREAALREVLEECGWWEGWSGHGMESRVRELIRNGGGT